MRKQNVMNRDWIATARTLSEALPYLQRYEGAVVVVKFGGHAMGDDEAMQIFARDIVLMRQVGVNSKSFRSNLTLSTASASRTKPPSKWSKWYSRAG